jgi:hypothetical protein
VESLREDHGGQPLQKEVREGMAKARRPILVDEKLWSEKRASTHPAFLRPEERVLVILTELVEVMHVMGARLEGGLAFKPSRGELLQLNLKANKLRHLTEAMLNGNANYNPFPAKPEKD